MTSITSATFSAPEILRNIMTFADDSTLARCLRASKTFYDIAGPVLYHTLVVNSVRRQSKLIVGLTTPSYPTFWTKSRQPENRKIALLRHARVLSFEHANLRMRERIHWMRFLRPLRSLRITCRRCWDSDEGNCSDILLHVSGIPAARMILDLRFWVDEGQRYSPLTLLDITGCIQSKEVTIVLYPNRITPYESAGRSWAPALVDVAFLRILLTSGVRAVNISLSAIIRFILNLLGLYQGVCEVVMIDGIDDRPNTGREEQEHKHNLDHDGEARAWNANDRLSTALQQSLQSELAALGMPHTRIYVRSRRDYLATGPTDEVHQHMLERWRLRQEEEDEDAPKLNETDSVSLSVASASMI